MRREKEKVLIGNGGVAREFMAQMGKSDMKRFVDIDYIEQNQSNVFPLTEFDPEQMTACIAIGDGDLRRQIVRKLPSHTEYFTFIHPTSLLLGENIIIGPGSFLSAYSIISENCILGAHSYINRSAQIGHDSVCGKYFTLLPGAILSGYCTIGENVSVGSNAVIKERIEMADNVTIGMLSCVTKQLRFAGTYVGTPAKRIK